MIVNGIAFKELAIFLSSRDEISSAMSSIIDPQSARSKSVVESSKHRNNEKIFDADLAKIEPCEESKIESQNNRSAASDDQAVSESGIVRLVNIDCDSLPEFTEIVQSLLPADGIIRGLEVYIGKLTAP